MSLTERIDEVCKVTASRGEDYGHPKDDFHRASIMKEVLAGCPDPELRHALEMIAVKLCRLVHNPLHEDSWVDIAGYARCAGLVIDSRAVRDGRVTFKEKTELSREDMAAAGRLYRSYMQGNTEHD